MVNIEDFFGGNYITAEKVKENKTLLDELTILSVKIEEMKDGSNKPMLIFDGHDETLVLNKTNSLIIKEALGKETDEWIGRKIKLMLTKTMYNGKLVPAVGIERVIKT